MTPPAQIPSVNRSVHYVAYGTPGGEYPSVCRAAIITAVNNEETGDVGLAILNPTGMFFNVSVAYDPDRRPGTWHYAPHVVPGEPNCGRQQKPSTAPSSS